MLHLGKVNEKSKRKNRKFCFSSRYDPINDIYHEGIPTNDTLLYGADIREAHGNDIHSRFTFVMRSLQSIVQKDRRIMQLTLVIMLFSKGLSVLTHGNDSSLVNPQKVYQVQNHYIEHIMVIYRENLWI